MYSTDVCSNRGVWPCDVSATGKDIGEVTMSLQLVYTDLIGPLSPPAMRSFTYASKLPDEFLRYKDLHLIQTKREAVDITQRLVQWVGRLSGFESRAFAGTARQSARGAPPELLSCDWNHPHLRGGQHTSTGRGVGVRWEDAGKEHKMPAGGQRAPEIPFERANVNRGIPGESQPHLPLHLLTTLPSSEFTTDQRTKYCKTYKNRHRV